jgi:hypothetical protein
MISGVNDCTGTLVMAGSCSAVHLPWPVFITGVILLLTQSVVTPYSYHVCFVLIRCQFPGSRTHECRLWSSLLGAWYSLQSNVYTLSNTVHMIKSRMRRQLEHVARMWEIRNTYKIMIENPERKRPLRTHGRKLEDSIKTVWRNSVWGVVEWIKLAEDVNQLWAVVNTIMNLWVLWGTGNLFNWASVTLSTREQQHRIS